MKSNVLFTKKYDIYEVDLTSKNLGVLPCVIIQNDIGNKHSPTTIIMPLVKEKPEKNGLYFKINVKNIGEIYVFASFVQVIDKKALIKGDAPISRIEDKETRERLGKYYLANAGMKKEKVNGKYQIVDMTQEELDSIYEESRKC